MTDEGKRKAALDRIARNIAQYGFHAYVVTGGGDPHYAYTIGLSQSLGADLILAGTYFYSLDEVTEIIKEIVAQLPPVEWRARNVSLGARGLFSFRKVDMSWAQSLMLGALDFYQTKEIQAFQIVPDEAHFTLEVPDLSQP